MKLQKLKLADIEPYKNNPRKNDAAVNAVAESIRQCSYITPIIVDEDHVIIAGHTRYKALVALGMDDAECLICDGLTEEQKKKYRFLDNKTGEKAAWRSNWKDWIWKGSTFSAWRLTCLWTTTETAVLERN